MGGTIAWTTRLPDGTEHRMLRWTNAMPWAVCNVGLLDLEPDHLDAMHRSYHEMKADWEKNGPDGPFENRMTTAYHPAGDLAPSGYGLLVIDCQTKTILHMQGYSGLDAMLPSGMLNETIQYSTDPEYIARCKVELPALVREKLPLWLASDRLDEQDIFRFVRLFEAGRIKHKRIWSEEAEQHEPVPVLATWEEELCWYIDRYLAPRGSDLDEERWRIRDYVIDFEGWTWRRFDEDPPGVRSLLAAVLELGFVLSDDELAGWETFIADSMWCD